MQAPQAQAVTKPAPIPTTVIGIGLMLMSFSSGCVDILSFRYLGNVFTSAMTGNVALMGLELGAGRFHEGWRNLAAFVTFLFGLVLAAFLVRHPGQRGPLMRALGVELVLLVLFAAFWRVHGAEAGLYWLITISAIAMGVQSATAQKMGMPGVSTTYFTGTMTGIVFGIVRPVPAAPTPLSRVLWPLAAFFSYVIGAVVAGWTAAGRQAHELSLATPAAPALAILVLLLMLAFTRPKAAG